MRITWLRDGYVGFAASVAGAVAGAIIAFMVTALVVDRVQDGAAAIVALLAGWLAMSVATAAAAFIAARPFTPNAVPIAFSVFVWSGLLVYPGFAVHRLFGVTPQLLVVVGAILAGSLSATLVSRLDPA